MKQIAMLLVFLLGLVAFGQDLQTKRVTEKIKGFKKTKKIYDVLKSDPNMRHGTYREYYKKNLVVEGVYKNNKKEGLWIYKGPEGKYLQKVEFVKGKQVGQCKVHREGVLVYDAFFDENSNLERFKRFDLDRNLIWDFYYDKGSDSGKGIEYTFDGFKVEYTTYKKTQLYHGVLKILYPDNSLFQQKKYFKGKLVSASDIYNHNREVKREVRLKDGNGIDVFYFMKKIAKSGEFVCKKAITYKDSVPNGKLTVFNEKGGLEQSGYQYKNQRVGKWKFWSSKKSKLTNKKYKKLSNKALDKNYSEHIISYSSLFSQQLIRPMQNSHVALEKNSKKEFSKILNRFIVSYLDINAMVKVAAPTSDGIYKIYLKFKLDVFGEVSDIKANKESFLMGGHLGQVLRKLPTFIPAHKNYINANSVFSLPIVFNIQ